MTSPLAEVQSDAAAMRERILGMNPNDQFDARHELANNIIPLFEAFAEAIGKREEEVDEAIGDLNRAVDGILEEEEILHAETTQKILGLFGLGEMFAQIVEQNLGRLDAKQRNKAVGLIATFRQEAAAMGEHLEAISIDDDEEESGEIEIPGVRPISSIIPRDDDGDGEDDEDEEDDDEDE